MTYRYTIDGIAADGQTWSTRGSVATDSPGAFPAIVEEAMQQSFLQLTQGKAQYGRPGVGCRGPYRITRLLVEQENQPS
jgi:hypothetical protein